MKEVSQAKNPERLFATIHDEENAGSVITFIQVVFFWNEIAFVVDVKIEIREVVLNVVLQAFTFNKVIFTEPASNSLLEI